MLERYLAPRLPRAAPPRRLVVLTGARQVGKTTLSRHVWGEGLRYLNLDSPGERARLAAVGAEVWDRVVGPAVLDEAQKAPDVFEKLKWSYDERRLDFSVLLGSSRILLLDRVRESLAGRTFLFELWPLAAGELAPLYGGALPSPTLLERLVADPRAVADAQLPVVGPGAAAARAAVDHVLEWGGLPTLLEYDPPDRLAWLEAYQATYLERDLADLARLRELDAFATCHRLAALRAGALLNVSDLARDAALPHTTVHRYLRYLELSYQSERLPAWSANRAVRLVRAPKLVWTDPGVQRVLSGQLRGLTGPQYENAITGQILATLRSRGVRVEASHLRTSGGLEVDLVLDGEAGLFAVEMKARAGARRTDATPIERARRVLGDRYALGLVVHRGDRVERLSETVWAVPDWRLLASG